MTGYREAAYLTTPASGSAGRPATSCCARPAWPPQCACPGPGGGLPPPGELAALAVAWLARNPRGGSTEQLADAAGCGWGRMNRVLAAARRDGAVTRKRLTYGPDRGKYVWTLPAPPPRRRTCLYCGRPVRPTPAGTLPAHHVRRGSRIACSGSGTRFGEAPPEMRPFTVEEFAAHCRQRGLAVADVLRA